MPIMDGYEATRLIRQIPTLENLPIIALSAGVFKSQIETAHEAGIHDFIAKPFDVDVAVNLIRKLARQNPLEEQENKTAPLFEEPVISKFKFPGIDVEMAFKIWDDTTIYQTYLLKFSTDCEVNVAAMKNADANELGRLAHKIKGTAGMLGLFDIGNAAAKLDELVQDGMNTDDAVEHLKQAIVTANNSIAQYISEQNTANSTLETKPFDSVVVAELLTLVLHSVEQDSPDGLGAVLDELGDYLTGERVEPLKLALDTFDFSIAKLEVIKLADEYNVSLGINLE
jgi:CheY-like chemotaxis protein